MPSAFSASRLLDRGGGGLRLDRRRRVSFSSSSLLGEPCSLAISCTRFLLIGPPILRAWGHQCHARRAARERRCRVARRAPGTRDRAARRPRRDTDTRRARPCDRRGRSRASFARRPPSRALCARRARRSATASRSSSTSARRPQPTQLRSGRCDRRPGRAGSVLPRCPGGYVADPSGASSAAPSSASGGAPVSAATSTGSAGSSSGTPTTRPCVDLGRLLARSRRHRRTRPQPFGLRAPALRSATLSLSMFASAWWLSRPQ